MRVAILTCSHAVLADEDIEISTYCPDCGLWVSVEKYEERA